MTVIACAACYQALLYQSRPGLVLLPILMVVWFVAMLWLRHQTRRIEIPDGHQRLLPGGDSFVFRSIAAVIITMLLVAELFPLPTLALLQIVWGVLCISSVIRALKMRRLAEYRSIGLRAGWIHGLALIGMIALEVASKTYANSLEHSVNTFGRSPQGDSHTNAAIDRVIAAGDEALPLLLDAFQHECKYSLSSKLRIGPIVECLAASKSPEVEATLQKEIEKQFDRDFQFQSPESLFLIAVAYADVAGESAEPTFVQLYDRADPVERNGDWIKQQAAIGGLLRIGTAHADELAATRPGHETKDRVASVATKLKLAPLAERRRVEIYRTLSSYSFRALTI